MKTRVTRACGCSQWWELQETPGSERSCTEILEQTPCVQCAAADQWTISSTMDKIEAGVYAAYRLLRLQDHNGAIGSSEINKWAMADAVMAVHFGTKTIYEAALDLHDDYMWAFKDAENAEDAKTV